jgi:predicted ABC-type ATPase
MMGSDKPSVIVLAGPNGAGKSTSARTVLAETLSVMTYVNADLIAQGLSGFDPESIAVQAGRLMLARLRTLATERADFAFETTLATRFYAKWLRELQATGYAVQVVYFWLKSPELAVARVAERVRSGGHGVPERTIRRRYQRSLKNFFAWYRSSVDIWQVYDNSGSGLPRIVAIGGAGVAETVLDTAAWKQMQQERNNE